MTQSQNSSTITRGLLQATAIEKLHQIIRGELLVHQGYLYFPDLIEGICDDFAQLNMQGAMSAEVLAKFVASYNDETRRTFWGTVAINMEYALNSAFPGLGGIDEFRNTVVSTIRVPAEKLEEMAVLDTSLVRPRLATQPAPMFTNPVDFWIICFLAFRMTVGVSTVYEDIRKQYDALQAAEKRPRQPRTAQVIVAS